LRPVPSGLIRPMRLPAASVNHSAPSGAIAIVVGPLPALGSGNSAIVAAGGLAGLIPCATGIARPDARAIPMRQKQLPTMVRVVEFGCIGHESQAAGRVCLRHRADGGAACIIEPLELGAWRGAAG